MTMARNVNRSTRRTTTGSKAGKRLLKLKDAAEYLGVGKTKMRQLAREGDIPFIQEAKGYSIRFDIRDLDLYIERMKRISPRW
ncbi:MAG: helix-turn-helix domain-containing protein [Terriglobia bacterium]